MRYSAFLPLLAAVVLGHASLHAQPVAGYWTGAITIMNQPLGIMVDITARGDSLSATITIPQQMAKDLPLRAVRFDAPRLTFELPAGPGLARFEGTLAGDSITGTFSQAGFSGPFALVRGTRPEEEKEDDGPPPYAVEEVTFTNGDVTLAGTLTSPASPGPHPAVVLVTGSGAQNRDEEIFGFKPFKLIADHLTRNGIAVLRYDDRGVGGSSAGSVDATTEDFMRDALAGVSMLTTRRGIDPKRIGILGHSEGGIVAPMAATRSTNVSFIVLLAAPSWPGDTIVMGQLERMMINAGADSETIARNLETQRRLYRALRTDEGWDDVRARMEAEIRKSIDDMTPEQRAAIPDTDALMKQRVEMSLAQSRSAWFRFFASFDPATALADVRVPVLALFGELDVQVPAEMNLSRMKQIFRKGATRDFTLKTIPSANHLFQAAKTGGLDEYAVLDKRFVPGLLETISTWIRQKTGLER